ncbi:MAG: carbon starvation protein A [Candidatus Methanomethylophilaceae archaeon]|nr:carbon starvation protein A [Candidatus Methanomethylophilaceae archaeon]
MNGSILLILSIVVFCLGYTLYGRWLAKEWGVDPSIKTPAHTENDGVDYVPAKPSVLMGHHFSSIAGAGPITGPIQAAVFGWVPVALWIFIGSIFIGAVHDFGSMFASVRNKGRSITDIISNSMGERAKTLFTVFAYLTLILVIAAFTSIVADTFVGFDSDGNPIKVNATSASISIMFIVGAVLLGFVMNRLRPGSISSAVLAIVILLTCIALGVMFPIHLSKNFWIVFIALYIIIASILPVWILLQPRDYLCSFLLYGILGAALVGILLERPDIALPGFIGFESNLGYLFPTLFITVACGAVSGFHSLVSSGTTSKQIDNERHMLPVAYGAMLLEGVLAIIALICVASLYDGGMPEGTPTQIFAEGISTILSGIGLSEYESLTYSLIVLAVSAFALTSLDTSTRLGRLLLQDLFKPHDDGSEVSVVGKHLGKPVIATVVTVCAGVGLALVGYQNIWGLFGAANQLLAVLAIMAVCAWLGNVGKNNRMLIAPMLFLFACTLTSLAITMWNKVNILLEGFDGAALAQTLLAAFLFILAIILMKEGISTIRNGRKQDSDGTR